MTQLYKIIAEASLPLGAIPAGNKRRHIVTYRKLQDLPLMIWPNGTPCHLANSWLTSVNERSTGRESSTTKAALLTHLIRFCYSRNISFYDFNDAYFEALTTELTEDTIQTPYGGSEKARSSNQTLSIQTVALHYVMWIQNTFPLPDRLPIIGTSETRPGIIIEWRHSPNFSKPYLWHRLLVTKSPPLNDKTAMPERLTAKIREEIYRRRVIADPDDGPKIAPISKPRRKALNYLYSRRIFVINMMSSFGLRPEELWDMPLNRNSSISSAGQVVLPTKKLRGPPEFRTLKVNTNLAFVLQTYIDDRQDYINFLTREKFQISSPNNMLIGENGRSFKKSSLTKEFDRICVDAGIKNTKVCLSMFRHRFITREVKAELILKFDKSPEFALGLTPALRDEVSRTVIKKTGHRRPSSIWPYVHDEYKLLTSDSSQELLHTLRDDLEQKNNAIQDAIYRDRAYADSKNFAEIESLRVQLQEIEARLYKLQKTHDS